MVLLSPPVVATRYGTSMLPIRNSVQHEPQGVGLNLIEPVQAAKNELCAANAYKIRAVPALISYLHGCAGYIPKATWIAGIDKGFYVTWLGLTSARVQKYLQKSEITTLGHQKLVRQNFRPTNKKICSKTHDVNVMIVDAKDINDELIKNMVAMDLPGRFLITSTSGSKHIFIMYDCYSDYIKPLAMKLRETDEMIRCYS